MENKDMNTSFQMTIKDTITLVLFLVSILSVYFTLKADIALAMKEPKPVISEEEYKYKDEILRKTILLTQKDVDAIKEDINEIKETLKLLESRLYEKE